MVILRTRNKITDFLMILAWASPFNVKKAVYTLLTCLNNLTDIVLKTQKAEQTMLEVKY